MRKILLYTTILILSAAAVSCENFLDINPKAEVVNDDMFDNAQGCEDAIIGLYAELKDPRLYGENISWHITEVLAQNFNAHSIYASNQYQYLGTYDFNQAETPLYNTWAMVYQVIGHTNNVIENLEKKDPDEFNLYDLYLGECYAIRAVLHFDALRLYAPHVEKYGGSQGIPYVTSYSFKETPFSTVSQCYDYIIADLLKAQTLLEADKENITWPRKDIAGINSNFLKGRELHMNYYAATAYLARVYWMKGDLAKAKTEALKVIDSGVFPLTERDQISTMLSGSLSPRETIFGVYSIEWFNLVGTYFRTMNTGSLILFYNNALVTYNMIYERDLGNDAGGDSRTQWFNNYGSASVTCHKLVDDLRNASASNTPDYRGLIEGFSLIRSVEMYYIVIEALLEESKLDAEKLEEATGYFDTVLNSRGLTKLSNRSPVLTLDRGMLYNDRHKEFFCEGQRWFEMKKLNMDITSNVEGKVLPADNAYYVLPIPQEEYDYRNQQ